MATDRIRNELAFHDRQARKRDVTFSADPGRLRFDDDSYLRHESWIAPAIRELDIHSGQEVLDYGSGHGMAAVVMARRGARVTALDLSHGYLREARARARANGVRVQLVQADAERLPFSDGAFDRVWGNAILHHLDARMAALEIRRVLRPGGRAVFCEPWGENWLLNWARRRLSYSGKARTPDEDPLRQRHIAILGEIFPGLSVRGFQFLAMARRVHALDWTARALEAGDRILFSCLPGLERLCRYVVIVLPGRPPR